MVADSVRLLREEGRRVFFDAEHFFDGFHHDEQYALAVVEAAAEAGAECVVLCDTNGGLMPDDVDRIVRQVVGAIDGPHPGRCARAQRHRLRGRELARGDPGGGHARAGDGQRHR
jgi:2-isopropylmalate synthase